MADDLTGEPLGHPARFRAGWPPGAAPSRFRLRAMRQQGTGNGGNGGGSTWAGVDRYAVPRVERAIPEILVDNPACQHKCQTERP